MRNLFSLHSLGEVAISPRLLLLHRFYFCYRCNPCSAFTQFSHPIINTYEARERACAGNNRKRREEGGTRAQRFSLCQPTHTPHPSASEITHIVSFRTWTCLLFLFDHQESTSAPCYYYIRFFSKVWTRRPHFPKLCQNTGPHGIRQ